MVRKRKPPKDPGALKNVKLHPALYLQLSHEALDAGRTIQEHVNVVLCKALKRDDLKAEITSPMVQPA